MYRQQLGDAAEVRTQGDQSCLVVAVAASLPESDVGSERVAQARASDGVRAQSPLSNVGLDRLGRAAVANGAGLALVRDAKVAQVAQTRPGGIRVRLGQGPRQ